MNAFSRRYSRPFDPFDLSLPGFWRDASAWWLTKAGTDRRLAAAAQSRRDAFLAEAYADLKQARDRAEKAREYGHRLP